MFNSIIYNNCKKLLINYPELREVRKIRQLIWIYWQEFCGITEFINYTKWISSDLPQPETITRAIRKVKELNPNLRGSEESQQQRKEMESKNKYNLGYSPLQSYHYKEAEELKFK